MPALRRLCRENPHATLHPHAKRKPLIAAGANRELNLFVRLIRFLREPAAEQRRRLLSRWLRHVPAVPVPIRVPNMGWWLARNDFCGRAMLDDSFERSERRFVEDVLRPGMTVLDIGAHHGLYTLLASRKVGPSGRVVAFEPSPRERNALLWHLRLNQCKNVQVEGVALGGKSGFGEFFVVEGIQTGCNCLRPPNIAEPTTKIGVQISTLDECLERLGIQQVDFIKIDAEGAELDIFMGAERLLRRERRPLILAEMHDTRTVAWGYRSKDILSFLRQRGFRCFLLSEHSGLQSVPYDMDDFNENVVAVPEEQERQELPSRAL